MTTADQKHKLREHLALISTETYLLLRADAEEERIKRYNLVQEQIDAILNCIDDHKPTQHSCSDRMIR